MSTASRVRVCAFGLVWGLPLMTCRWQPAKRQVIGIVPTAIPCAGRLGRRSWLAGGAQWLRLQLEFRGAELEGVWRPCLQQSKTPAALAQARPGPFSFRAPPLLTRPAFCPSFPYPTQLSGVPGPVLRVSYQ